MKQVGGFLGILIATAVLLTACGLGGVQVESVAPAGEPTPTPTDAVPTPTRTPTDAVPTPTDAVPTPTVPVPDPTKGKFELSAPGRVQLAQDATQWNLVFDVTIKRSRGGSVSLSVQSGPCSIRAGTRTTIVTSGQGKCVLSAEQEATETHPAAAAQTKMVVVDKAVGSFDVPGALNVLVGEVFSATPFAIVGAQPQVVATGVCTHLDSGQFEAAAVAGSCQITFEQMSTELHTGAGMKSVNVSVGKRAGSFSVAGTGPVTTGATIQLTIQVAAGADPELESVAGGCIHSGGLDFLAPLAETICIITYTQPGNDGYSSGGSMSATVVVNRAVGVFTANELQPVPWGSSFEVPTAVQAGGDLSISATGGCIVSGLSVVSPNAPAQCQIIVSQAETTTHTRGPDIVLTVDVIKRQGTFSVGTGVDYIVGDFISVAVLEVIGGAVNLGDVQGPCVVNEDSISTPAAEIRYPSDSASYPADAFSYLGELVLVATAPGSCSVTLVQSGNDRYFGSQQTLPVAIGKRYGWFEVTAPPKAGFRFELSVTIHRGGSVEAAVLDGPCLESESDNRKFEWYFASTDEVCRVSVFQLEDENHLPDVARVVEVIKVPGVR